MDYLKKLSECYYYTNNGVLLCGDCSKILPYIRCNIDLIVMDPPYNVSVKNYGGSLNKIKKFNKTITDVVPISNGFWYDDILPKLISIQHKTNIYIWCNKKQIPRYFDFFINTHNCLFDILFWYKQNAVPSYNNKYLTDCEYLLYFKERGAYCKPKTYEDAKTVFVSYINHKDKKLYKHPTVKPLNMIEKIIRNSSTQDNIILDPFIGSGTTAVACEKINRKWIGIEINEKYCEITKQRIINNEMELF